MNKKVRIAFTGVFDLANFGDHLFPMVFVTQMKKRGIDCELTLFSIFRCRQAFNDKVEVKSIYEIDKLHQQMPFDAVVVGGGDIVHYELFKHKAGTDYIDYPIFDLWIIPSLFAKKYKVPLIWNAPGIPYDFNGIYSILTKNLIYSVDYLSVRNIKSKNEIVKIGIDENQIHVVPDTGFLLRDSFSDNLNCMDMNEIGKGHKYVVLHVSKLIPDDDIEILVGQLEFLKSKDFKIILLPLAYTNDDDIVLKSINERIHNEGVIFEKKLSLNEIISIISGCSLYIGFSFHGAITAYCYGKKAISYNYTNNRKTVDLFDMIHKPEYHIVTAKELHDTIEYALNDNEKFDSAKEYIMNETSMHFDNIVNLFLNPPADFDKCKTEMSYEDLSSIFSEISRERQKYSEQYDKALRSWSICADNLERANKGWKECAEQLDHANQGWKECSQLLETEREQHNKLYHIHNETLSELQLLKEELEKKR